MPKQKEKIELLAEMRCQKCNKLLSKGEIERGILEVKCTRCKNINQFIFNNFIAREHSPPLESK